MTVWLSVFWSQVKSFGVDSVFSMPGIMEWTLETFGVWSRLIFIESTLCFEFLDSGNRLFLAPTPNTFDVNRKQDGDLSFHTNYIKNIYRMH